MTTTSDHSWMDDVIEGKDYSELLAENEAAMGYSAPGAVHESNPVKLVVEGFQAQRHLFSTADLEGYINTALQNEAGEMIADKTYAGELSESWEGYAESLRSGQIPAESATMTVEEAASKGAAAVVDFEVGYAESRRLLAETVAGLHDSKEVAVTAETWGTLADLDGDGYFSECLGFDAQSALVAAIKAEHSVAVPAPAAAAPVPVSVSAGRGDPAPAAVDFSRETAPDTGADRTTQTAQPVNLGAVRTVKSVKTASRPGPKIAPKPNRQSGDPVPVGKVLQAPEFTSGWSQASRDKLTTAMIDYETTKAGSGEPEMG